MRLLFVVQRYGREVAGGAELHCREFATCLAQRGHDVEAAGLTATVLHPTAHDEPSLYLPLFRTTFRHPATFAFSTEEEKALVRRHFGGTGRSAVIGIGVDLDAGDGADEAAFRTAHGIDRPYLCSSAGWTRPRAPRSSSTSSSPTRPAIRARSPSSWWATRPDPCPRIPTSPSPASSTRE